VQVTVLKTVLQEELAFWKHDEPSALHSEARGPLVIVDALAVLNPLNLQIAVALLESDEPQTPWMAALQ
jgi:hypothetical protein